MNEKMKKNYFKNFNLKGFGKFIPILLTLVFFFGKGLKGQILLQNNFDTTSAPLGTGWVNQVESGTMPWARATASTFSAPYTGGPYSGSGMCFYDSWNQNVPGVSWLVSPAIPTSSITSGNGVIVSFWALRHSNSTTSTDMRMSVWVGNTNNRTTATLLDSVYAHITRYPVTTINGAWVQYTYTVPSSFLTGGNLFFFFRANTDYWNNFFMDEISIAGISPMTYSQTIVEQPTSLGVGLGSFNNPMLVSKVVTSGLSNPLPITSISYSTTGTSSTSLIANAKCYYTGRSPVFSTNQQYGSTVVSPSGTITFNGNTNLVGSINSADTNCFWLTYDITPTGSTPNVVNADNTNITINGIGNIPSPNSNPGFGRQVLPPLSGDYTVGTFGDYPTLTEAASSLSAIGVSGPVNFILIDNVYNTSKGEIFPITFGGYVGMSPSNRVTFKPSFGNSPIITDSNATALLIFDGSKYIDFMGAAVANSTIRNMVVQNRSLSTSSNVVILRNEAIGINISNINFRSGNNSNVTGNSPGMIYIGGSTNVLGIGNDSNVIRHNTFSPVYASSIGNKYGKGVVVSGQNAVLQNDNITIDSNYFYGFTHAAIYVTETNSGNGANFNIRGNSIYDTATAVISTNNIYGIWFNPSNVNSINNNISGNYLGGTLPFNGGSAAGLPKQSITQTGFWWYYGIFSNASVSGPTNITNNFIRNFQFNAGSTGYFTGIYTGSGMLNILNNTIGHAADTNNMVFNGGGGNNCTGFSGIYSFSTGITNIKNNVVSSFTSTETLSNTIFGVYTSSNNSANINIDSNIISRMTTRSTNLNTTTCAAFIGIFSGNSSPNVQIRGNIIGGVDPSDSISLISPIASSTKAMGMYITGGINNIINNRVQNFYTNSNSTLGLTSAALGGIYLQSATNGQIMSNNWVSDFKNYGLQGISVYGLASVSGAATINNNNIRDFNITSNSINTLTNASINGIVLSTTNIHSLSGNLITNLVNLPTSAVAGTQINGIYSAVSNQVSLINNNINNLVFNGPGAGSIYGIYNNSASANQIINQNNINRLIVNDVSNNNQTVVGIYYSASNSIIGNLSSVIRNNIHSINSAYPTGFTPVGSLMYGVQIVSGTATVSNNLIRIGRDSVGNIIQKAVNYRGIIISSTGGQLRVYHNNILTEVNPDYGAVNTSAIELTATPSASLFAFTDIRNNILVNNSINLGTASGNHYGIMYPTSLFQLFNGANVYTIRSDFNLHFNAASGNSFIGRFNAINFIDLNSLRTASSVTNLFLQESSSGYANPAFINSTGGASAVDLRLQSTNPAESMGDTTISSFVTDDINGSIRSGRQDIGAHSGTFTLSADVITPSIYFTNLINTSSSANRVFQATIYDAGLVATGTIAPRVYFRKNQGSWLSSAGALVTGTSSNGVYNFTVDHLALGGISVGDSIYYYVIAQDVAGNINSRAPYALASGVNSVTAQPLVAASYIFNNAIPNTVYVGSGSGTPSYPSLTGNTGVFAAINASALTGNTNVLIQGNTTETGDVALNKWLESGTGNYSLTIRPADGVGQVAVSGTSTNNLGMIRLIGTDNVNMLGWSAIGTVTDTNLVIRCSSTLTPAISFIDGGSNDTIKNVIVLSRNTSTAGVNAGTINLSPSTTSRGLTNLAFINNYIRMDLTGTVFPAIGIYAQGTAPRLNNNITITGNHFVNFTSNGVQLTTGLGNRAIVSGNHFYYNYGTVFTSTATLNPILINASTTSNDNIVSNNWIGGSVAFATGAPWTMNGALSFTGINLNTGLTTGTNVDRNVIQNITLSSTTNSSQATGILVAGTAAIYNITNNRIGSLTQSSGINSAANQRIIGIQSTATGNITITGDTVANIFVLNVGTIAGIYGINVGSGASNITNISNNLIRSLITSSANIGTTTACALAGIVLTSTSLSQTITNNTIRTLVNQTAATHSMYGILVSSGSNVISNNAVYGLNSRSTYTGTTTLMALSGIHSFASVTGAQTLTNNSVDSVWLWTATPTTTQISGISVFNTFGQLTFTDNNVRNINTNTSSANTQTLAGLSGVLISCPSAVNNNISRNIVSVINHNHTAGAVHVVGMLISTSNSLVGNNTTVARNFIHSLRSNSTASPILTGIANINGFSTFTNNMVRMGIDSGANLFNNANTQRGIWHQTSTQANYYHNTVLMAGSPGTGALNTAAFETSLQILAGHTLDLRNNIFANITNTSGAATGFNFGVRFQDSLRINSDYNIIYTPSNNGIAGGIILTNSRFTLLGGDVASWKSVTKNDFSSAAVDPNFDPASLSVADFATLALNSTNPAEKSGDATINNITEDYFGNSRSINTPSDIGAHSGNFAQSPDAFPPIITFTPFTNAGSLFGTRTLSAVRISDNNGIVNTGINRPRIYYTRDRLTWYSTGAINIAGSANNLTADFVIDYSLFSSPLTFSDSISYFVVAQDNAGNVQSSAPLAVGSNVRTITQYPLFPNQYKFLPVITANTVLTVGIGQPYTSLTGVGGLFEFLNSRTLGGNISAEITSNLLNEPGTIALNQLAEDGIGAGTFSVTIRPIAGTSSPRIIEGSGSNLLILNGANRIKLTGIPTGGNSTQRMLRLRNTNSAGVNILANSATGVLLSNLIVENGNTSTANGGIEFRVGAGSLALIPCSFDTLNNNIITNNTTATLPNGIPQNSIYMLGNPNVYHNNIVVSNNEISNFLLNGFFMAGNGGDGFRITNNNVFYNLPVYTNVSGTQTAINLSAGSFSSGNIISGNVIGGSAVNAGGLPWTVNQAVGFNGISTAVGNNASTLIQNNTIQNINFTNQTGFSQFLGIRGTAGNTIIGGSVSTGNLIGHPTITNSIRFSQQTLHSGILYFGTNNITIVGNSVQGFFINAPALSSTFYGIDVQGGTILGINNNTVGSATVANSIVNTGTNQTVGIIVRVSALASPSFLVNGNTIANLVASGNQPTIVTYGLFLTSTIGGNPTVTNNIINNISTNSTNLSTLGGAAAGLVCNVAASSIPTIRNNTINAIRGLNNGNAATMVTGLTVSTGQNATINGNRIFDITNASTSTSTISPVPVVNGIQIAGGNINNTIVNNQITIGTGQTTNTQFNGIIIFTSNSGITMNVFNNSILVEGAASSGNQNSYAFVRGNNTGLEQATWLNLRNNIFANRRTGGTGFHFAIANQTISPTNNFWNISSSAYNLLVSSNLATIGQWGLANNSIAQWRTNATSDELSYSIQSGTGAGQLNLSNLFNNISTGDLNLNANNAEVWYAFGKGIAGAAINNLNQDFANTSRGTTLGFGLTLGSIQLNTTPSVNPPLAIASSNPIANTTTTYTFANRNIASVNWGTSAPTSANLLYFTGVNSIGTAPAGNNLNQYLRFDVSGGTAPYNYSPTVYYDLAMLGNINSVNNLKISNNTGGTLLAPSYTTQVVNPGNRTVSSNNLTSVTGVSAIYLTATENAAPPTVLLFTPSAREIGGNVTIRGSLFTGVTSISFNGTNQPVFTVVNDTLINTTVPLGANTGTVSVTNAFGTGTSSSVFTVIPVPTITSMSSNIGARLSSITINGTGFTWATQVQFNGVNATFNVVNNTTITAIVPATATSGIVTVTSPAGVASSASAFTVVLAPTIASFTPSSGASGISVSITGTNFQFITNVRFNGAEAVFTVNNITSITAIVPNNATTGLISIVNGSGVGISGSNFTVLPLPTITGFTPTIGGVGTLVSITGTNFTGATAVRFNNNLAGTFTVVNAGLITAVVPSGTTTGIIKVTTPAGADSTSNNFVVIGDLIVSTVQSINGTYNNVTVTSTGNANLNGVLTAFGNLTIQSGGRINFGTDSIVGSANFVSQTGSTLTIGSSNGITATGGFNGNIQVSGTRTFNANATYNFNGFLPQTTGNGLPSNVDTLIVNNANGLSLSQALTVNRLTFTSGKLFIGNNNIRVNGSVIGASAANYIVTNNTLSLTGALSRPVANNSIAVTFPIGTSFSYTPAQITLTNTSQADVFTVRVVNGVLTDGLTGSLVPNFTVNRSWLVNEAVNGGSNATINLTWDDSLQTLGFNRFACGVARHNGVSWLAPGTYGAATGTNPYSRSLSGINGFGVFSVTDNTGTLPVEISRFTAKAIGKDAYINWITVSEINNSHFELERSVDGVNYELVDKVKGAGNSNTLNNYQIIDNNAAQFNYTIYYRLKQIDYDGKESMFGPIKVVFENPELTTISVEAYPNPFNNQFNVEINGAKGELTQINIIDIHGKLIKHFETYLGSNIAVVNLESMDDLQDGIYFLKVNVKSETRIQKIIKTTK